MGLDEYNRKRDFQKTAEPPGKAPPKRRAGEPLIYVIQKHAASRLHYDFRLELDGVLMSWSVPKGPSLDPREKRLAVRTEDHPIDYADFEGIIPKGEYGGGTVLLWDRGSWEPIGDAHAGVQEGNFKFLLKGDKLQGGFALIKLKGRGPAARRGDERSWLLIKERDATAKPESEVSIVATRPESVTTQRDLPEIAADKSSVWHSNRAQVEVDASSAPGIAQAPLPRALKVAKARASKEVPDGDDWLHEMEIAGERFVAVLDAPKVTLRAADGKTVGAARAKALTPLIDALRMLPARQAIVDGTLTLVQPDGRTSAAGLAGTARSKTAEKPATKKLKKAASDGGILTFFASDLLYLDGFDLRGVALEQRKALLQPLVAAGGAQAPMLRLATHIPGNGGRFLAEACRLGIPAVVSRPREHRYQPPPGRGDPTWLVTQCPAAARTKGKTGGGRATHPTTAARPAPPPAPLVRAPTTRGNDTAAVEGVRLSSPDRVLWPDPKVQKRDLARYYQSVAAWALPHFVGRPLTLYRCPEGVGIPGAQPCFYMKHANFSVPANVERILIREKESKGEYLVIRDLAGLIALVQMSILEIHTWGSQATDVDRPDRITMDLDPDPTVEWEDTVVAAHLIKQRFEAIGLESFVKTTGGKGLHVVAPLAPVLTWEEALGLSRGMAEELARAAPQAFTAVMSKDRRKGKIFLDYQRNHRGSTAVAAFSTRARPGATVSVPLSWEELTPALDSSQFTVQTVPDRVATLPADPWARYFRLSQKLSAAARRLIVT